MQTKNRTIAAVLMVMLTVSGSVWAQGLPPRDYSSEGYTRYEIKNELELQSVLAKTEQKKHIVFKDNVLTEDTQNFDLNAGDDIILDLDRHNFQGPGSLNFNGKGKITLIGSTTAFKGGMHVNDNITLNMVGLYAASTSDAFGKTPTDDVVINLTTPNSGWNATNPSAVFITNTEADPANYSDGTIVIANSGKANFNVAAGNWVRNAETIVGALPHNPMGNTEGVLNVYDVGTNWKSTGTLYVGFEGKGITNIGWNGGQRGTDTPGVDNITGGVRWDLGSIGVGIENGSDGTLNIRGIGDYRYEGRFEGSQVEPNEGGSPTIINIFGRNDLTDKDGNPLPHSLRSRGAGIMQVDDNVIITMDEKLTESGFPSKYAPKISLGAGDSYVSNSYLGAALDNAVTAEINGDEAVVNSLTFKNHAVMEGQLDVKMDEVRFNTEAVLTPGFGKYMHPYVDPGVKENQKNFGRIQFNKTGETKFVHESDAYTFIDFDIHGDLNAGGNTDAANHGSDVHPLPGYPNDGKGYLGDLGRDVINVNGDVELAGTITFRPQSGYYSDQIDIHFMEADGSRITGQYENIVLHPSRWFDNWDLEIQADGNHLVMDRNQSPFTNAADCFNTIGVAGALDEIYNSQHNYDWLHILDWVWLMNDDELHKAMMQLSGETRGSSFYMPIRTPWKFGFDRVNWSKKGNNVYFGPQRVNNPKTSKQDLWVTPYYDYMHMSGGNCNTTATTQRVSFMSGYDRALRKSSWLPQLSQSAFGVVFGYSQPKLDQGSARVLADDYLFGIHFATRLYNRYELKMWGSFGTQNYRLRRNVPVPGVDGNLSAKYSGNTFAWSTQAAMPLNYRNGVIRPFVALDVSHVTQGATREQGAYDQIILDYHGSDWTQLFGRIGARADYDWRRFNLTASAAYSYQLAGHTAPIVWNQFAYAGGSAFTVQGNHLSRSFFDLGLGTQIHLDKLKRSVLFVQYNGSYGRRSNSQTASIGYQLGF